MKRNLFVLLMIACVSLLQAQSPTPAPAQAMPPLEDFVGKYVFPDGSVVPEVDAILTDGVLIMTSAAGTSTLTVLGVDSFLIVEFSGYAAFKRGDDKKVNAVHIEAGGYILDGQKQTGNAWSYQYYLRPSNKEVMLSKK